MPAAVMCAVILKLGCNHARPQADQIAADVCRLIEMYVGSMIVVLCKAFTLIIHFCTCRALWHVLTRQLVLLHVIRDRTRIKVC